MCTERDELIEIYGEQFVIKAEKANIKLALPTSPSDFNGEKHRGGGKHRKGNTRSDTQGAGFRATFRKNKKIPWGGHV